MKTNKEIITEIIGGLNLSFSERKGTRITKESLIECWSECRTKEYNFYGYSFATNMARVYRVLFKDYTKPKSEAWKAYILRLNNYKYCSSCNNLQTLTSYTSDASMVSLLSKSCKQCRIKSNKKYRDENRDKCNALEAKHRSDKLNRTPSWLCTEDLWLIKEFYSLAKERERYTGIKWHVDHVIPLRGKHVSGLHVPNNLQVITATENLSKNNTYNIDTLG